MKGLKRLFLLTVLFVLVFSTIVYAKSPIDGLWYVPETFYTHDCYVSIYSYQDTQGNTWLLMAGHDIPTMTFTYTNAMLIDNKYVSANWCWPWSGYCVDFDVELLSDTVARVKVYSSFGNYAVNAYRIF